MLFFTRTKNAARAAIDARRAFEVVPLEASSMRVHNGKRVEPLARDHG